MGANWAAINHVTNLAVFALAIDPTNPSTLYAGTTGGVFKSTDMGVSRAAINHVTNLAVFALAIDPTNPSTFYAGTTFGGVFKRTDMGASWAAINRGLTFHDVYALAVDPTNTRILYAGTHTGGMFKSTNMTARWTPINNGLTFPVILALALDPTNPSTLYAGTTGGVFKSTDRGANWSVINNGLTGPLFQSDDSAVTTEPPKTVVIDDPTTRLMSTREDNGTVVIDDRTGLMWTREDNGHPGISWPQAVEYCANLTLAGFSWRLPTIDELAELHDPKEHDIRKPFRLTKHGVWSSTIEEGISGSAWHIDFMFGERWQPLRDRYSLRALCVVNPSFSEHDFDSTPPEGAKLSKPIGTPIGEAEEARRSSSDDREARKRSAESRRRRPVLPPLKTLHVFDIKLERPPSTPERAHSPRIAFVSTRNGRADVYSINPDGSGLRNLTRHSGSGAYPSWSPDGSRIAYRRGYGFYVMNADGSGQRMVVKISGDNPEFDLTSHWSPDSSKLVFASNVAGFPHRHRGIFVVGPDGLTFLSSRGGGVARPSWSHDGSKILFESWGREPGRGIYVMNSDGRNPMKLAEGTRPVWSPDGSKIAFEESHIYSINPDGSELQNLTADGGGGFSATLPSWSPDGSQLAFKALQGGLWVMNADGSNKRRLADQLMFDMYQLEPPSWSPDGSSIAFTGGDVPFREAFEGGSANYYIYVVKVDGSNLTRLTTHPAFDHDPVWSPRGQQAPPPPPIPPSLTPSSMPFRSFFRPNRIPLDDGRGSIRMGDKDIALALKDHDSETVLLYIDRDGDGDPLNDTGIPTRRVRRFMRWSDVELGGEGLRYRLAGSGPFPDWLYINANFAWRAPIHIDGKRMQILVLDEDVNGIPSSGDQWALRLEGDESTLRHDEVRRLDSAWVETDRVLHVHVDKGGQVMTKLVYSSFDQSPASISGSEATTVELSLIPIVGPPVPRNLTQPKVVGVANNQARLKIADTEITLGIKRERTHSWLLFVDKTGDGDPYNDRPIRGFLPLVHRVEWSNVDLHGRRYHLTTGLAEREDQQEEPVPEWIEIRPDFLWGATLIIKGDELEILVIDAEPDGIPSPGDVWHIRRFQDRWELISDELPKLSEALIEGGGELRLVPLGPSSVQVHFDPQLQ